MGIRCGLVDRAVVCNMEFNITLDDIMVVVNGNTNKRRQDQHQPVLKVAHNRLKLVNQRTIECLQMSTAERTDRLDTATGTHTLLSTDVHIMTDHVRYTLRYLHCFSVVSCPHPSDSALNGILYPKMKANEKGKSKLTLQQDSATAHTANCSMDELHTVLGVCDVVSYRYCLRITYSKLFAFLDNRLDDKSFSTE
ncbi:hypothetical protein ANN_01401 [Periplaneta americana]|uniref:Uncharacterized protein n=1 Tax=Periplaneta americana TaxID=6978 RepID=A0ABQ8TTG8_PERAM|nr:hypothetical protein ANN_01401 [Periplaneta americana]